MIKEQSRRDDMESLGYVFLYFIRGSLPWQGLRATNKKQKYERICEKKQETTIEQLCKGYPQEFAQYMTYCRKLEFTDKPDYVYLRALFRDLLQREGHKFDLIFDWMTQDGVTLKLYFLKNFNSFFPFYRLNQLKQRQLILIHSQLLLLH